MRHYYYIERLDDVFGLRPPRRVSGKIAGMLATKYSEHQAFGLANNLAYFKSGIALIIDRPGKSTLNLIFTYE